MAELLLLSAGTRRGISRQQEPERTPANIPRLPKVPPHMEHELAFAMDLRTDASPNADPYSRLIGPAASDSKVGALACWHAPCFALTTCCMCHSWDPRKASSCVYCKCCNPCESLRLSKHFADLRMIAEPQEASHVWRQLLIARGLRHQIRQEKAGPGRPRAGVCCMYLSAIK